jgi:hypothetical protein
VIHRSPTESEAGAPVYKNERGGLGAHARSVSRLPSTRRAEGRRRSPFPRSAPLLHGRECSVARPAGTLRSVQQRMETLRPIEQGWRRRSLLRHARLDTLASMIRPRISSRCSTRQSCARMGLRPEQRGAGRASARSLACRLHHENPRKIGRLRG